VVTAVDLESRVAGILPTRLQPLGPAIVGGAQQVVAQRLTERLADPETRERLTSAFEVAYARFLSALEGDGLVDGVTIDDDELVVNFLPLIGRGLETLQRFGLLSDVTIPDMTREGDPAAQTAELEQALGRDLPDGFGQIVVFRSASVAKAGETADRAQQLLVTIKRAFALILVVTVLALVGAVLLAQRRARAVLILLLASAAVFVIARAIVDRVLDDLPSAVQAPAGQAALAAASTSLADGLVKALGVGALLFLLAAAVVYLLDPECAVRRRIAARTGSASLATVIAANRGVVMGVSLAAALLVITIAGWNWFSVVIAVVLAAIGLIAWRSTQSSPAPPAT
jgi:hypothetical protein